MRSLRALVAGLKEMGEVEIRGQNYTGPYLSMLVATNPELPEEEANNTPRLVSELGRITAAALYEKEVEEARYRAWKADMVHEMTNDLEAAENAGFKCAVDPGTDSRGKDKPKTCPSRSAVEEYLRTLPEYLERKQRVLKAEEAWATVHAAFEAAQARVWAIKAWERTGGTTTRSSRSSQEPVDEGNVYHSGDGDTYADRKRQRHDLQSRAAEGERSPLPPLNGPPPPPPGAPPKTTKRPPPPPSRS